MRAAFGGDYSEAVFIVGNASSCATLWDALYRTVYRRSLRARRLGCMLHARAQINNYEKAEPQSRAHSVRRERTLSNEWRRQRCERFNVVVEVVNAAITLLF